jgi:hypothetical protein
MKEKSGSLGPTPPFGMTGCEFFRGLLSADALVLDQQVSGEKAVKELGWSPRAGSVLGDLKTGAYTK